MPLFNRALSVLLAVVFVVAGIVTVLEIVGRALGHTGYLLIPYARPARWLNGQPWTDHRVIAGLIVLAVLGLLLLIAQLKPRRAGLLVLHSNIDGVTVAAPRRSLARAAARVAGGVDGVSAAHADLGSRAATVTATTHLRDTTGLAEQVQSTVSTWLGGLGLERTPTVKVALNRKDR